MNPVQKREDGVKMIKNHILNLILRINGKNFEKEYFEIKSINSKEALLEFHQKHLKKLLLHAYNNVPYYHHVFKEIGLINNNNVDLSKFNKIPILTKEIIRKHYHELISKDYTKRNWYYNSSGGSTGEPLRFIQDNFYLRWDSAVKYYYNEDILGIDEVRGKKIFLWGSERDIFRGSMGLKSKIDRWLRNTVFLNSFRMTEDDMKKYIKIINSYKPEFIEGYAGSLYELCRYAEREKLKIYTPRVVVSTAETLSNEMREKIEDVFRTKVYDLYGSREVVNLAGECKEGLMHIFLFGNCVEILNTDNKAVKEGEEGKVIVTDLHNYSMPFIRYEIGDMAVFGTEKCKCGNILPTLKNITGRITDHFVKEDGAIISGSALTITFNLKDWVKKFQIIQKDYKKVEILIVRKGKVNEFEKREIEDKIKFLLGQDCEVIWSFVDIIPKTPQGKYLYIKSLLWR